MNSGNTIQIPVPKQQYYNNVQHLNSSHNNVQISTNQQQSLPNANNNMQNQIQIAHSNNNPALRHQQQPAQIPNTNNMNNNNNFRNSAGDPGPGLQQNQMEYRHNSQQQQNRFSTNNQHQQSQFPGNNPQQQNQFSGNNQQQQNQVPMQQQPPMISSTVEVHPNVVLGGMMDADTDERPHVCQVCQAAYKTRTHLRRHMFSHLNERPYPCTECPKGFNRKEHLNKHIEAIHSGTKYKCPVCGKEISRKDHLARHIKNMHGAEFSDSLLQDLNNSIPPEGSDLTLPTSSSNQKLQEDSSKLDRLSQDTDFSDFFMDNSPPSSPKSSLEHLPKLSTLNTPLTIIDQLKYSNELLPLTSEQENKRIQLQLFTCKECGAAFTVEKDLNMHLKVHRPQPYKCDQCHRAYTRREKLSEHIRCYHQGQKFSCEYCDKQLSRKDHVLRHVRSVHPEVLTNRFVTIAENEAMDYANGLGSGISANNSKQINNNGTSIPSMGDMGVLLRSVCPVCLKVFGTSYHLQRHCDSCHNGDARPYPCTSCKKQFKRKDHLAKHIKLHCPTHKDPNRPRLIRGKNFKKSIKSTLANRINSELSTIDQKTMNSLQIEMRNPDEDVEVALAIVNNTTKGNINQRSTSSASTSIIIPTPGSGITINTSALNAKLQNSSSSTYTHNLNKIINSKNNNKNKTGGGNDKTLTNNRTTPNSNKKINVSTRKDFTCGHCELRFSTKYKMIQHLQQHPSTTSPLNTSSNNMSMNNSPSTTMSTSNTNNNNNFTMNSSNSSSNASNSSVTRIIDMINKDLSTNSHLWTQ